MLWGRTDIKGSIQKRTSWFGFCRLESRAEIYQGSSTIPTLVLKDGPPDWYLTHSNLQSTVLYVFPFRRTRCFIPKNQANRNSLYLRRLQDEAVVLQYSSTKDMIAPLLDRSASLGSSTLEVDGLPRSIEYQIKPSALWRVEEGCW